MKTAKGLVCVSFIGILIVIIAGCSGSTGTVSYRVEVFNDSNVTISLKIVGGMAYPIPIFTMREFQVHRGTEVQFLDPLGGTIRIDVVPVAWSMTIDQDYLFSELNGFVAIGTFGDFTFMMVIGS